MRNDIIDRRFVNGIVGSVGTMCECNGPTVCLPQLLVLTKDRPSIYGRRLFTIDEEHQTRSRPGVSMECGQMAMIAGGRRRASGSEER